MPHSTAADFVIVSWVDVRVLRVCFLLTGGEGTGETGRVSVYSTYHGRCRVTGIRDIISFSLVHVLSLGGD